MLQVCLNGSRPPAAHPALPCRPADLARAAGDAVEAGAGDVHVHPKDREGRDTMEPEAVAAALYAIRLACPGVPVGVTTGLWTGTPAERRRLLASWIVLPDHVSINFHEPGAVSLTRDALARGVAVDAGVWTGTDGVDRLLASGLGGACRRILVEVTPQDPVHDHAAAIVQRVTPFGRPVLLHGEDDSAWAAVEWAAGWRLLTRIGLEDTLVLPDGSPAQDNAELVRYARNLLTRSS